MNKQQLERKTNEEIIRWISSSSLIPVYMIHLPTVYVCTKFQSSRPHSSWEKSDEKFQRWKLERKKNEKIKGWISSSSLILVYMIHLPTVHACTNFQSSRPHSSREKCDEKFQCWKLERKKNEEIKGQISSSNLIPVHMIYLPTVHVCTKFQSSRPHSSRGKCDKKCQCWKLERKKNEDIKGQISSSYLIPVYLIHLPTAHVRTKFQSSKPHSSREKCDEKFKCLKGQLNLRFHNMSIENLIRPQGHVTLQWLIRSSRNWNSSEILWLSWLPARLMKIWSKMNKLAWRHHFPIIKSMGNF